MVPRHTRVADKKGRKSYATNADKITTRARNVRKRKYKSHSLERLNMINDSKKKRATTPTTLGNKY